MHVRARWYCGVAPLADGRVNVCVVTDQREGAGDPLALIWRHLNADAELRARFAGAECVAPVSVLGPMAVDVSTAGVTGLFLAGDAAGFVDPMTGDGLNLALNGSAEAAGETSRVLETGDWEGAVERLNMRRAARLGSKLRFNRALRTLTSSPTGVRVASAAALVMPGLVRRAIVRAGDAA
jgi:flavin-dependent dehydrogenase